MRRALLLLAIVGIALAGCTTPPAGVPPTPTTFEDDAPRFDGFRAMEHVRAQVLREDGSHRFRVPGSAGNVEVAQWATRSFEMLGWSVSWHHFNATYGCETVAMHNIVAERPGTSDEIVMFGAHYDTRPIADKDPDPARRGDPVPGAVDGASGVAVLLELARVLPPSNATIRMVLFDGEDGGEYKGRECTDWILGSTAYARDMSEDEVSRVSAFVLVDMVGDPDMTLPWEMFGRTNGGRALQDAIYDVGHALGHGDVFLKRPGYTITDDHVPFIHRGIPAVDLIHLVLDGDSGAFPAWHHTVADDVDALSADSLATVGRTLESWFRATVS